MHKLLSQTRIWSVTIVGVFVALLANAGSSHATDHKVDVCHVKGNGATRLLSISENARQKHLDHGDFMPAIECGEPCGEPPVPNDFFSGPYLMEQLSGLDAFFSTETFGDTQIVNIVAEANTRSFNFLYFPGIFDSNYRFEMTLCQGEISVLGTIDISSLGCGSNIGFSSGMPLGTYDETFMADDVVLVNVTDFDPDGSCDSGGYPVQLRFTKQ